MTITCASAGLDIRWTLTHGYGLCRTGRTYGIDLRIRRLGSRIPQSIRATLAARIVAGTVVALRVAAQVLVVRP